MVSFLNTYIFDHLVEVFVLVGGAFLWEILGKDSLLCLELANFQIVGLWQILDDLVLKPENSNYLGVDGSSFNCALRVNELLESLPNCHAILQILFHGLFKVGSHVLIEFVVKGQLFGNVGSDLP